MAQPVMSTLAAEEKYDEKHGDIAPLANVDKLEDASTIRSWNGVAFTEQDSERSKRKIDLILVPTLLLYYFCSFLDRGNIANAKVAGMLTELGIPESNYNVLLTLFLVSYIAIEFPVTIYMKKIGANRLLPTLVLIWGLITLLQGFTTNYAGLAVCRFLLGLCEGGLTPTTVLLASAFVPPFQLNKRVAVFLGTASLAGAFSGLLSYGITKNLTGTGGRSGWRWIFIIEGAMTMFVAIVGYYTIPASPSAALWLTPAEKAAVHARMAAAQSAYVEAKDEHMSLKEGVSVLKSNVMAVGMILLYIPFGFFLQSLNFYVAPIVAGLGWTPIQAQLMTVPPFAVAYVGVVGLAVISDRIKSRGLIIFIAGIIGLAGFAIAIANPPALTRYGALFLQVFCGNVAGPALATWTANIAAPHLRRAVALSVAFSCTNVSGLAVIWSFRAVEAPRYLTGTSVGLACAGLFALGAPFYSYVAYRNNQRREEEMAKLPRDHVFPEGPVDDRDVRFRYAM